MAREARYIVATGRKRLGKTYQTMLMLRQAERGVPSKGVPPRRSLIVDFNDEYGEFNVKAIAIEQIPLFCSHPIVEIRRIRPFYTSGPMKGQRMNMEDMPAALVTILKLYMCGVLVIEDINKYTGDSIPQGISGAIATNAHASCDVIMHMQSVGRILPKMWQNINMIRYHHQNDTVSKSKDKLEGIYEMICVAEKLVDKEFFAGNIRFFVWVDIDNHRIVGNFTKEMFEDAISEFISDNPKELSYLLIKRDEVGKPVYLYSAARLEHAKKLFDKYWGNPI